ncbi:hypothetical protein Efla_001021 [Eimeria flavescens]
MADVLFDESGFERPREESGGPAAKRSSADTRSIRFSDLEEAEETDVSSRAEDRKKSAEAERQSVQAWASAASSQAGQGGEASPNKPTVLLGIDGRPLSILKGNRPFAYAQARRLAEHLRVKFATDRNETRFYCPDTSEHMPPPPAHAELRVTVRGFLRSSKKTVQDSKDACMQAQRQLAETSSFQQELNAVTQQYVVRLEFGKDQQKANPTIIVAKPVQRRGFCCGGASAVLPPGPRAAGQTPNLLFFSAALSPLPLNASPSRLPQRLHISVRRLLPASTIHSICETGDPQVASAPKPKSRKAKGCIAQR